MRKLLFIALLFCLPAFGQVTVSPFVTPNVQFLSNSGTPLAGGKVCTFAAGSTTPQTSYSDSAGSVANANPVVLDSAGRASIWLTTQTYKIVVAASTANSQCSPAITSTDNVSWATMANTVTSLVDTGALTVQASAAANSGANQSSPLLCVQGNYWTGAASASDKWCLQDLLGTGSNPTTTLNVTHGAGSSGTAGMNLASALTVTGASTLSSVTAGSLNNLCMVDGTAHAQTDAGIQACVNAVADGGMVFMPQGTYTITGTITIAKRITVMGAGWGTVLQVGAGVGATTDIFLLMPSTSTDVAGMRLQDFYITPASGTPGRSGIMVDGTNASVANLIIDHVRIDTLGSYAFNIQNVTGVNASVNGTPYEVTIRDSYFSGGTNLTNAGDTIRLESNKFTGPRDLLVKQIGAATTDGGAHGLVIINNNITQTGGTVIQNAWQGLFGYNDVEQTVATTEANSAMVDVQGNASANVQNFKIIGNYLGGASGNNSIALRIDRATGTEVLQNYLAAAAGAGGGLTITANGLRTHVACSALCTGVIGTALSDGGTGTAIEFTSAASNIRSFYPLIAITNSSGTGLAAINQQIKADATSGRIGFASGDPTATGIDTWFSRSAAGIFSTDKTAQGDGLGKIIGADWIGPVGATTPAAGTFTTLKGTMTGASLGASQNLMMLNAQGAVGPQTGNSSDQVLYTYTLPASTIDTTSKSVIVRCAANHSAGTANTTLKININGVNAITGTSGTAALQSASLEVEILRTAATTGGSWGMGINGGATVQPFSLALTGLAWGSSQTITCTENVANTDTWTGIMFDVKQIQ